MGTTQKKHKFNAIDAAVVVVIIALIGAALFFFLSENESDTVIVQTTKIEYTIEFRSIRDEFADNFTVGNKITDGASLYRIGEIVAIDVANATYSGTNLVTGELSLCDYPEHSNVTITVSADASVGELERYVVGGGYDLSVGTLIYVRSAGYTGYGYCTSIRQIEGGAQ